MDLPIEIYIIFPLIAYLYASVGHGGASGYIAIMSLLSFSSSFIRPIALILNILVSSIAFGQYKKVVLPDKKILIPLCASSIPAAFLGGFIQTPEDIYKKILAVILFIAVFRMLFVINESDTKKEPPLWFLILAGLAIGFLSGITGIGGGVLLSPLLLLTGYASTKNTALISSFFIAVNSIAGLVGMSQHLPIPIFNFQVVLLILLTLLGGWAGSYSGAIKFSPAIIKTLLTITIFIAGIKLIST